MGTLIGALYMLYMKHKSGMRKWLSDWNIVYAVYEA